MSLLVLKGLVSVDLGPGMMSQIFDGIQRPLSKISEKEGMFIAAGSNVEPLDQDKLWDVEIVVKKGDVLTPGMVYATTRETKSIIHKVMVPPNVSGTVIDVKPKGSYRVNDTVITLDNGTRLSLHHPGQLRTFSIS